MCGVRVRGIMREFVVLYVKRVRGCLELGYLLPFFNFSSIYAFMCVRRVHGRVCAFARLRVGRVRECSAFPLLLPCL